MLEVMEATNLQEPFIQPFCSLLLQIDSLERENNILIFICKIIVFLDQVKLHVKWIINSPAIFLPYLKRELQ